MYRFSVSSYCFFFGVECAAMSKSQVFIIESLRFVDEENGKMEGFVLQDMLRLSGKLETKYFYIRTAEELKEVLKIFKRLNYRYLHISCHGDKTGIELTIGELSNKELADILKPYLDEKRVFFSACGVPSANLSRELFKDNNLYSVVGPARKSIFRVLQRFGWFFITEFSKLIQEK